MERDDGCPQLRLTLFAHRLLHALQLAQRVSRFQNAATPTLRFPKAVVEACRTTLADWAPRVELRRSDVATEGDSSIPWCREDEKSMLRAIGVVHSFVRAAVAHREGLPVAEAAGSLTLAIEHCSQLLEEWEREGSATPMEVESNQEALEKAIEAILLSTQSFGKMQRNVEGISNRSHQFGQEVVALGLERVVQTVREGITGGKKDALLAPLVKQHVLLSLRWTLERTAEWSCSCKFGHVFLGLAAVLMQRGFCKAPEEEADDGKGELDWQEDVEGTGMGEGEGENDVSKQIEDPEEQLMGTTNEKKEEGGNEKEEDDAIDMELDFEGSIFFHFVCVCVCFPCIVFRQFARHG